MSLWLTFFWFLEALKEPQRSNLKKIIRITLFKSRLHVFNVRLDLYLIEAF